MSRGTCSHRIITRDQSSKVTLLTIQIITTISSTITRLSLDMDSLNKQCKMLPTIHTIILAHIALLMTRATRFITLMLTHRGTTLLITQWNQVYLLITDTKILEPISAALLTTTIICYPKNTFQASNWTFGKKSNLN